MQNTKRGSVPASLIVQIQNASIAHNTIKWRAQHHSINFFFREK